jgi:hypothetical protein
MPNAGEVRLLRQQNGVWLDSSNQYLCANHWKLAEQTDAANRGDIVLCRKCLMDQFSTDEMNRLPDAGPGTAPLVKGLDHYFG